MRRVGRVAKTEVVAVEKNSRIIMEGVIPFTSNG